MIQKNTLLKIVDNSGANLVKCIHVYSKGKNEKSIKVYGICKISVKRLKKSIPKKKVKKSEVLNVLIVSISYPTNRKTGLLLKNRNNYGVILNKDSDNMISNRIVSPIMLEIRKTKFSKLLTLAPKII